MADDADRADAQAAHFLAWALQRRRPVPTECEECGEPCAVLPNGARCRFCTDCLRVHQEGAG